MSGSLDIYPFKDTETSIRFCVQVILFLTGLMITNFYIIKPALKIQAERTRRTLGNREIAQNKLKAAGNLENSYNEKFQKALIDARNIRDNEIIQAKELTNKILANAQEKAMHHIDETKLALKTERVRASASVNAQVADVVRSIYSKFGIS